ncbi:hypothetical protein V6N13_147164 [Hibiscus sabdariffa]
MGAPALRLLQKGYMALRFKLTYKDQNCDCKSKGSQWRPLPISLGILTKAEIGNKNGGFNNGLQWRLRTLNGFK